MSAPSGNTLYLDGADDDSLVLHVDLDGADDDTGVRKTSNLGT